MDDLDNEGRRTATARRHKVVPLLGLALALLLAGLFWRLAFTRRSVESTLFGNAQVTVVRTETTQNRFLLVAAIIVLSIGIGIFVALITRGRWGRAPGARRRGWIAGAVAALIVATVMSGTVVATRGAPTSPSARGALSHTDFRTTSELTTAMDDAGLGCAETRPARPGEPAEDAVVCSVPWGADIRDGHDDVVAIVWRSDAERDTWLSNVEDDTPLVVGSTWAAVCEFRSTCGLIAHRLRPVEG